jgi:hypothetical protein
LDSEVFSRLSAWTAFIRSTLYPPVGFRPLSETLISSHRLQVRVAAVGLHPWRLAPLGFLPLQHLPVPGVYWSRVCLALYVALSGFDYPLSGFLLRGPGVPFFRPQRSWGLPLQRFVPTADRYSSQSPCSLALCLSASGLDRKTVRTSERCSRQ